MACVDNDNHPDERQPGLEDARLRGRDRLKVYPSFIFHPSPIPSRPLLPGRE